MDDQAPRPRIRRKTAIWLAVIAAVSCAIVGLVVLAFDTPSSLRPSPAGTCTIGYSSGDARATFSGRGAATMCAGWHSSDSNWHPAGAATVSDTSVCTGRNGGLSWTVVDDGQQVQGKAACGALSQWTQGGALDIP